MYYILYGEDKSMISHKLAAILKKHKLNTYIRFDALNSSQSDVLSEMDSLSIFDDIKMICIENCSFLSSKNMTDYEIEPFLVRKDTECIVVFIVSSAKLDGRKKLVKELSACSTSYACIPLDEKSIRPYVQDKLKEYKITVDSKTLNWMCARIGYDPLHIEKEMEKISTFSLRPSYEDITHLMVIEPVDNVFKMTDAFFDHNGLLLMAFYRNFRKYKGMETVAMVALLASQIRFMFQVHVLMDQGLREDSIAKELHAHPYRVKVSMQKASRFSSEELLGYLSDLSQFDRDMKMGKIDKDDGFEYFCLNMMK